MNLTNFHIEDTIAVVCNGRYHDLHNCFNYDGFNHDPRTRSAELAFVRGEGEWIKANEARRIVFSFVDVDDVKTQDGDVNYPSEFASHDDSTLNTIGFTMRDEWDWIGASMYDPDFPYLMVDFLTGRGIKLRASSATVHVED